MTGGLQLRPQGPLVHRCSNAPRPNRIAPGEQEQWFDAYLETLVRDGAVIECRQDQLKEVSPVHLVPKAGPKRWRAVFNMRRVSRCLKPRPVKYEGIKGVVRRLGQDWWLMSFDISDAYHHIGVAEESQAWLGLHWRGRWYRWTVLPFGLSHSPFAFTKVMREMIRHWRRLGVECSHHLDDVVVMAASREELLRVRDEIVAPDLDRLGWIRDPRKGFWAPVQRAESVLGYGLDTTCRSLFIPAAKVEAFCLQAQQALEQPRAVTARQVAALAGKLVSFAMGVAAARAFTRRLYESLQRRNHAEWAWDWPVGLTHGAAEDLRWLLANLATANGRPMWYPAAVINLFSDASDTGWGGACNGLSAGAAWTEAERALPINERECIGFQRALEAFSAKLPLAASNVQPWIDNTVACAYVSKSGRKPHLAEIARQIWLFASDRNINLLPAKWLASADNAAADAQSRVVDKTDWMLRRDLFRQLDQRWGPHTIDRFAAPGNQQVARFDSRRLCPEAEAVDCFSRSWAGENNWVVPPASMIDRVLQHLVECSAQATLVVPVWAGSGWWPRLQRLMCDQPMALPPPEVSFVAGASGHVEPWKSDRWRYWAVRVDGSRESG